MARASSPVSCPEMSLWKRLSEADWKELSASVVESLKMEKLIRKRKRAYICLLFKERKSQSRSTSVSGTGLSQTDMYKSSEKQEFVLDSHFIIAVNDIHHYYAGVIWTVNVKTFT